MNQIVITKLLTLLQDEGGCTKDQLKSALGLTTEYLCKTIDILKSMGLEINFTQKKGYHLQQPLILFQKNKIKKYLPEKLSKRVQVDVLFSTNSTNIQAPLLSSGRHQLSLCVADHQTAGRGRQESVWESPLGSNCYSSLLWQTDLHVSALEGLSLIAGLALLKALAFFNVNDLKLKWPNDILWHEKKLAGILIEINHCAKKRCQVIIGTGVNLFLPKTIKEQIEQPVVDVYSIIKTYPDKNQLVACFTTQMAEYLEKFCQFGFFPFRRLWNKYNAYLNQRITLYSGSNRQEGVCLGVDQKGNLLVKMTDGIHSFSGGDISVRKKMPEKD